VISDNPTISPAVLLFQLLPQHFFLSCGLLFLLQPYPVVTLSGCFLYSSPSPSFFQPFSNCFLSAPSLEEARPDLWQMGQGGLVYSRLHL